MYKLRFCFLSRGYCNAPVTSESGRTIKNDFSVWTLFGHLTEENCCLWQKNMSINIFLKTFGTTTFYCVLTMQTELKVSGKKYTNDCLDPPIKKCFDNICQN